MDNFYHCDIALFIGKEYEQKKKVGLFAEVILKGKGQKKRTVYLQKRTVQLYLKMYKDKIGSKTRVFNFKTKGKKIKHVDSAIYYRIKNIGQKILNRHIHPHMIRHTVGQHMADDEIDFKQISSYFGHATTAPTEIYVKNSKAMNIKAAQKRFTQEDKPMSDL